MGYLTHVGSYNTLDLRGSYTPSGYLRLESEFRAPRLFDRRGTLSVLGGWREATQVGFYGVGGSTSVDDKTNYGFRQPYLSATLDVRPVRHWLLLTGGLEYSQWEQIPGDGTTPSVEEIYTPEMLPGLNASSTYLHSFGTRGDRLAHVSRLHAPWRVLRHHVPRLLRLEAAQSFRKIDYEAVQHLPLFRDRWVLSFRGRVETTYTNDDEVVPFFMMPALGGGSSLRGFTSWRFRDLHSLLLQAEWRVLVNNFFDTALFFDTGKVTNRRSIPIWTASRATTASGFACTARRPPHCASSWQKAARD